MPVKYKRTGILSHENRINHPRISARTDRAGVTTPGLTRAQSPEVACSLAAFYRNAAKKFINFTDPLADADVTKGIREHITRLRNEEAKRWTPKTMNRQDVWLPSYFSSHCLSVP